MHDFIYIYIYMNAQTIKFLVNINGTELNGLFQSNKEEKDWTIAEAGDVVASWPPANHSNCKNSQSRQQVIMRQRKTLIWWWRRWHFRLQSTLVHSSSSFIPSLSVLCSPLFNFFCSYLVS